MPSAVQTLDISPVGRVEGDLDVRVNIQDGVVVDAWTQAELFRGFEVILRDKDPQAGLVVTPRACGICGASHLTCAAWALDTAWQTEVPRNAILARNLGQIVESLQSLPRHHYGLFMIDYTNKNYSKSKYYEEAVKRWSPFTGTNYEIGVTISGKPVEIYALLGGQWPHSSYMVPGGVMCAPTLTDVTRAWSILEYFRRDWMEKIWLGCTLERYEEIKSYDDFMAWLDEKPEHANSDLGLFWRMSMDCGMDKFGKGHGRFISWGYLPHEDKYQKPTIDGRNAALIMKSGVYDGKTDQLQADGPEIHPRRYHARLVRRTGRPASVRPHDRADPEEHGRHGRQVFLVNRGAPRGKRPSRGRPAGAADGRRRQARRVLAAL